MISLLCFTASTQAIYVFRNIRKRAMPEFKRKKMFKLLDINHYYARYLDVCVRESQLQKLIDAVVIVYLKCKVF